MPQIVELDVSNTALTDHSLLEIAKLTELKTLLAYETQITGANLHSLLKACPNLRELNLDHTLLSDEAALQLQSYPALQAVSIVCDGVSDRCVETLRDSLPNTDIDGDE